jgi:hypothetical protein
MGASWLSCVHLMNDFVVVASVDRDFSLHAWESRTQSPVCPTMVGHTAAVTALRTGVVGGTHLLASASMDGTVRLWDLSTGGPVLEALTGHEMGVYGLEIARLDDRDVIVSGAGDGRLRLFDASDGADLEVELEPFPSAVHEIRIANIRGTPTMVAADRYGLIRVWDTRFPRWRAEIDIGSTINGLAIDRAGRVGVASAMGGVTLRLNIAEPTEGRVSS